MRTRWNPEYENESLPHYNMKVFRMLGVRLRFVHCWALCRWIGCDLQRRLLTRRNTPTASAFGFLTAERLAHFQKGSGQIGQLMIGQSTLSQCILSYCKLEERTSRQCFVIGFATRELFCVEVHASPWGRVFPLQLHDKKLISQTPEDIFMKTCIKSEFVRNWKLERSVLRVLFFSTH